MKTKAQIIGVLKRFSAWRFVDRYHDHQDEQMQSINYRFTGGNFVGSANSVATPCYCEYGNTQEEVAQRLKDRFIRLFEEDKYCRYDVLCRIIPGMRSRSRL